MLPWTRTTRRAEYMTTAVLPLRRIASRESLATVGFALWALAVGAFLALHLRSALLLGLAPLVVMLLVRPQVAAALAVATIPFFRDLIGSEASSVNIDASDVFFYLSSAALIAPMLLRVGVGTQVRYARVPVLWSLPFSAWMLVVLADHWSMHSLLKTGHAYELFLLPMVVGAVLLTRRSAQMAMWGFIGVACLVALLWIVGAGGVVGQKNPSGQFMTDSLLLTLVVAKDWRYRLPPLTILAVGLLFTASRGALLSLALGGIAFLAIRGLGSWRKTVAAVVPLTLAIVVGYNAIPDSLRQRLGVYSVGSTTGAPITDAEYTIKVRQEYRSDGLTIVREHPIFGIGAGNYRAGNPLLGTQTVDPHQMLIRTAADEGIPGLLLFLLAALGTAWAMLRRLTVTRWAAAALVLQVAIFAHGFVDVYWVRGTPVLGWLLVGMAFNPRLVRREPEDLHTATVPSTP